jgi:hypothetical protein
MEDTDGFPVVLEILLPNDTEVTFEPDTDNYPIVGGVAPALEDKTIKVSSIGYYAGVAGTDALEYIKVDDQLVVNEPYAMGYDGLVATQVRFEVNIKEKFGQKFLALRNKLAVKLLAAPVPAGDAKIYVYGMAVDRTE